MYHLQLQIYLHRTQPKELQFNLSTSNTVLRYPILPPNVFTMIAFLYITVLHHEVKFKSKGVPIKVKVFKNNVMLSSLNRWQS